ncbi:MAG: hypothetical protein HUJ25_06625, partial [Crocinitomicaceae bacterium]|nr:hypothetical protein [Crocinitomicaceae bacterium]
IQKGDANILNKLKEDSTVLKGYVKSLNQGDLNLTTSSNFFSENKTTVKLYRGRNIQKFQLIEKVAEFVDEDFKTELVDFNSKNTFIVLQEITGTTDQFRIHACLTHEGDKFLFGHTANKILLVDQQLNKIIVAILNSKLMDWFFRKTSTNNHVMGYEIEQFPIKMPDKKTIRHVNSVVDKIMVLKSLSEDTSELELKLDILIFKLYKITTDEIKTIYPEISLTEQEYENFKIH